MEDLISVIVPVYKVENYIHKCIDSIINQTYTNLEIILVDDGSPDNCGKICDEYAKNDKRIRVIHKENGGLSDARNVGIDIAKGKYISFIDSDDTVTVDYIEYMHNMIKEDKTEIAISEVQRVYKESDICDLTNKNMEEKRFIWNPEQCFYNMLFAKHADVCAYAKLYNINLFNDIRYPKGEVYEDSATTYKMIDKCERISYGSRRCYNYYTRPGSISKQGKFNENEYYYIKNTKQMLDYIKNKYPNIQDAVNRYEVYSKFRILRMLVFTEPRNKEFEKEIVQKIKFKKNEVVKYKDTPKRDKLAIYTLGVSLSFFKWTWYIYSKVTGRIL